MKLYTEEDIRKAWNTAYTDALAIDEPDYKPKFYEDFIQSVTPIELPTDEEVEIKSSHIGILSSQKAFIGGAKWMRDKIQGGDK